MQPASSPIKAELLADTLYTTHHLDCPLRTQLDYLFNEAALYTWLTDNNSSHSMKGVGRQFPCVLFEEFTQKVDETSRQI